VLAARVGVVVVAGLLAASCVNLRYPAGASRDGGGEVVAHLGTGHACGQSSECQSGFCVDGFCCKTSCDQKCYTCAKDGNEGFCMPVEVGKPDLRGLCVDENRASCGRNGLCDGAGGCQKYPVGTVCQDSTCFSASKVNLPSRCNADGSCEAGPSQECFPYTCYGGKCLTSCTMTSDCVNPQKCENGSCGAKALGASCLADADCGMDGTGMCRQGVCCAMDCGGGCMSCALPGSEGSCLPVPAGVVPTADGPPCKASDATTCGLDGKCDGAGACRNYIAGTKCNEASCTSATLRGVGTCDGKTHCQVPAAVSCGGFLCASTTACRTSCTDDLQCASPSVCGGPTYGNACGGLSAQYFRQTNLTDLAISRTDPAINFHWFGDAPSPLLNKDNFSVRWHGKITPRFTEDYTFYASTDDGERLFIGGVLVIDKFVRKPADPEDVTKPIPMMAGKPVDVVLEYFESGGDATAVLSWSSLSEPKAPIPTSALSPQ
jgi:hypothetical protein